jgi:hypothetical protein
MLPQRGQGRTSPHSVAGLVHRARPAPFRSLLLPPNKSTHHHQNIPTHPADSPTAQCAGIAVCSAFLLPAVEGLEPPACYTSGAYVSGAIHRVKMGAGDEGPLPPNATVFYRVGDPDRAWSRGEAARWSSGLPSSRAAVPRCAAAGGRGGGGGARRGGFPCRGWGSQQGVLLAAAIPTQRRGEGWKLHRLGQGWRPQPSHVCPAGCPALMQR